MKNKIITVTLAISLLFCTAAPAYVSGQEQKSEALNRQEEETDVPVFTAQDKPEVTAADGGIAAQSAEIVDRGLCGKNVTWTLDAEGVLVVSGEGEMWDYPYWNGNDDFIHP